MSPTLATVITTILLVVDQSMSSPLMASNDQRQMNSLEKSDVSLQKRSITGTHELS